MKRDKWLIMPDVWPLTTVFLILTVLIYFLGGRKLVLLPIFFLLFTLFFFRNPPRKIIARENEIVSPADGVVLCVEEVAEERYFRGTTTKVSIFLNLFNVHVNRTPITGIVDYFHYQPGKFFPAFKSHASQLNERNYLGLRSEQNSTWAVLVVQITGFIARRVVCWAQAGEKLKQGNLLGMIKFGSCTELYLPSNTAVLVKKGQKVKAGATIIGRFAEYE